MAEVQEVQPPKNEVPVTQSNSEPAAGPSGKKRPGQEKKPEPAKKSRSLFSQVYGTLKQKAKQESASEPTEAVKKRREIDARIYGKINRDVNLVRRQEEAKRDRHSALRKEEELAIKDDVMKFRQNCFPRLAGFLLTSDDIPPDTDENTEPAAERNSSPGPGDGPSAFGPSLKKKPLTHPPPLKQPPALYFLPAILTPAQKKFLDAQQDTVKEILVEEQKEWEETKEAGLEEVKTLRRQAEDALAPVKKNEEEIKKKDQEARGEEEAESESVTVASVPAAQAADEEMEVEQEGSGARGMDTEERIEY